MERKFKVGDKVRTDEDKTGVIVFIDNKPITGKVMPYVIDYSENSSDWCCKKESDLTLIAPAHRTYTQAEVDKIASDVMNLGMKVRQDQLNGVASGKSGEEQMKEFLRGYYTHEPTPDPRYKEGDEVWSKQAAQVCLFEKYSNIVEGVIYVKINGLSRVHSIYDIEPYTGQDKVSCKYTGSILSDEDAKRYFEKEAIKWANGTSKPDHPFAVILKSGVKIGISSTMFDYINEQDNNTASVQTVEDGSFILSEIAAIVPTENLMS